MLTVERRDIAHGPGLRHRVPALLRAVETVCAHAESMFADDQERKTTALMEGLSILTQAVRSRARGYRNLNVLETIVYVIAGRPHFGLYSLHSRSLGHISTVGRRHSHSKQRGAIQTRRQCRRCEYGVMGDRRDWGDW